MQSDRHQQVLEVLAAGQWGVREKTSQLAGGEGSYSTALQHSPICAHHSRGSRHRGNSESCQLSGLARSGNRFDGVCSISQPALDASLSTLARVPTLGHKIKTAAPWALLNFSFTTE